MTAMIYKKISDIMKEISAIAKDRDNKMQGFKFRSIDQIYNELHPRLGKHGVFTVPEVLEERREERATKSGGISQTAILRIQFTFFAEDGSSVKAIVIGEGADSGDKATNKAMAIAHKYALLQVFAIPTEEEKDPDATSVEHASIAKPIVQSKGSAASTMVAKFRALGVSESMIKIKYSVTQVSDLSDDQLKELRSIGVEITKNKKPLTDFFMEPANDK